MPFAALLRGFVDDNGAVETPGGKMREHTEWGSSMGRGTGSRRRSGDLCDDSVRCRQTASRIGAEATLDRSSGSISEVVFRVTAGHLKNARGLKKGGGWVLKAATCRHGGPSAAEGYGGRSRTTGCSESLRFGTIPTAWLPWRHLAATGGTIRCGFSGRAMREKTTHSGSCRGPMGGGWVSFMDQEGPRDRADTASPFPGRPCGP